MSAKPATSRSCNTQACEGAPVCVAYGGAKSCCKYEVMDYFYTQNAYWNGVVVGTWDKGANRSPAGYKCHFESKCAVDDPEYAYAISKLG